VTAPKTTPTTPLDTSVAAAARSPALPPATWDANRSAGAAQNLQVAADTNLRPALQWAAADAALAAAGKPTLSAVTQASPSASAGVTTAALTADQIEIPPQQLYYGVVEGSSAATDAYWAVGVTQKTSDTSIPLPALEVWKRVASGPWTVVASGGGACAKLPPQLDGAWGGHPKLCATTN
jgi:hypothetical protein